MKISVLIPTHNRKDKLKRAVQSVYNQTVLPDELIVVDDGSSPAIPENFFSDAPTELNVKLVRNQKSKGVIHTRNRGIREVEGGWIVFLDDDDRFVSHKIEEILKKIEGSNDDIDLLYHPAKIQMVNENVSYVTKPREFREGENIFKALLVKNYIGGAPMVSVKKEKLLEVGFFDENLEALEDYELWIRLAQHNAQFCFLDEALTECFCVTEVKSLSKDIQNFNMAIQSLEKKYADHYNTFSEKMNNQHKAYKFDLKIQKYCYNKDYLNTLSLNLLALYKTRKIKYCIGSLASLMGPAAIFKLRALIR